MSKTEMNILELLGDYGPIYTGRIVKINKGGLFKDENEINAVIKVDKYLCGGGKLMLEERRINGYFSDLILNQLYLVAGYDDHVKALIPLENEGQYIEELKSIISRKITRSIIVSRTAHAIVHNLRLNWSKCRIYDLAHLPLIEKNGSLVSDIVKTQYIYGTIGKRIKPYIIIESVRVNKNKATVEGIISKDSLRFTANLEDNGKGSSFSVKDISFPKTK